MTPIVTSLAVAVLLGLDPTPQQLTAKGRAFLEMGECDRAVATFEKISGEAREDPSYLFYAAKAYDCAGKLDKALDLLQRYDQRVPNNAEVTRLIGSLLARIEKSEPPKPDPVALRRQKVEACNGQCWGKYQQCVQETQRRCSSCKAEFGERECDLDCNALRERRVCNDLNPCLQRCEQRP